MWCPPKAAFTNCSNGAAFAALRWHELFSNHTPDIFHPSLFNLPGLLKEAQFIGERIPHHAAWQKHLQYVCEEVSDRSSGLEASFLRARHKQMLTKVGNSQTRSSEATGLSRLLLLEGIEHQIETGIASRVRELDLSECGNKKSECNEILTHAGTVAYRRGGVTLNDQDLKNALEGGDESVRKMFNFEELFQPGEFECVIGIQGTTGPLLDELRKVCDHESSHGFQRIYKSGTHIHGLPSQEDLPEQERTGWLCCRVNSSNAPEAVERLKERVRNALNIISLFYQRPAKPLHPGGWIIVNGNAKSVASRDDILKNHHPRARALKLADHAVRNLAGVSEPSIFAALDLQNAALSTSDHRFRLVNLWSALECLTAVLEGDSIINRALNVAPPLLAWRNIDKQVRYLAINLHLWIESNPDLNPGDLPFRLGHKRSVPPERLLRTLTLQSGDPDLKKLFAFASGHPLLNFRLFEGWKHFSSPKSVRLRMERNRRRLRWHLYRIYRARNLLVHDGIALECLPQMADHLQHYVSWLTGRMIQALGHGNQLKLQDAWQFWMSKVDYVYSSLPERDDENPHLELQMDDVFTGRLLDPSTRIWQNSGSE
jgi:hypothetical protein